ncbi:rhodanese-like domain-containing protein [Anaerolineae bacterium CFX9]|jgi:rhodanese-related sulfurtransferase|nr:rhodanese-like domain-containing protein [Anaerolineae bacterium CFX9]
MSLFQRIWASPGSSGTVTSVNAKEASTRLKSAQPPFILDVRQPEEFRDEHIAGAHLIPLGELERRMNELPRDREILCVCRSGARSSSAARRLAEMGFKVNNLSGGMIGWMQARLPVEHGSR